MCYLKCVVTDCSLPDHLYFVEFNLGLQLSNLFKIKCNNRTPHAFAPNAFYSSVFQLIKTHHITLEELTQGTVNNIYKRIVYEMNDLGCKTDYHCILNKSLPSYLQSFNSELHFNLLPLKSMFLEWRLDNQSTCYFCDVGQETTYHVFGLCEKLKGFWKMLSSVHLKLTGQAFCYERMRKNFHLDFSTISGINKFYKKTVLYMNTVANYCIWKHRNDICYNFVNFDVKSIVDRFIRSVGAQKHVDKFNMTKSYCIPYIDKLYDLLVRETRQFPFDNG